MRFAAVGIASAVVYALLVAWVPLLPNNLYTPLLDLGKITAYTWTSAFEYLAIIGALYALYAVAYLLVRLGAASSMAIFVFGAIFAIELIGAYPATAVDVFGYIAHGRVLADHHANPFLTPPNAYPGDPILPFLAFPGEPSQYGPAWVLLGDTLAWLARGDLLTEIVLYKVVAALAHLAGGLLVLGIARQLGAPACFARASSLLFVWNPLLLWEMVGNAHNDGLMVLGALLAVWLLLRGAERFSLPALIAGGLIKLPVVVIAPLLVIAVARRRVLLAVEGAALAVVLAAVVYRPFWEGSETLTALRRTDLFTASLGSVLRLALAPQLGMSTATEIARAVSLGAFGLVLTLCVGLALRARTAFGLLTLAYVVLLAGALLATTWFQAWYLVWPFAFGVALADGRRHLEVAALSLGGFLQYLVFIYLWVIGVFPPYESFELQTVAYLAIIGPLLLALVVTRWPRPARVSLQAKEMVDAD
jgi:alpha-1,6-mannosyltransferase